MARVNVDIVGISELKWTGMGEFNSDDHYIYYCGQESLRRNGVAIMVNKRAQNAVLGCNLKNNRMISVRFQAKPFSITVIQAYAPTSMQVKKQQLELDMEQQTGSKKEKEYVQAVYCHPAYLTYMQSTSWGTLGWMKHKLESRLPGEISITSDMQMTPPLWQKVKKN